jgi:hypothetical protein
MTLYEMVTIFEEKKLRSDTRKQSLGHQNYTLVTVQNMKQI